MATARSFEPRTMDCFSCLGTALWQTGGERARRARVGRGAGRHVVNALQGRLGDGVLANLIQYLSLNQASGCLQVVADGHGSGQVYMSGGTVLHVEAGDAVGLPGLAELLGWRQGRFAFSVGVQAPRRTLDLPVDALLLHATHDNDVNGRVASVAHGAKIATVPGSNGTVAHGTNGLLQPTPLVDPAVVSGLVWAAVAVAGPIGEIFVDEAFDTIGHSARLLPEGALGALVQAVAGRFKSSDGRERFLLRAEAVLAHHGYGRVEGKR